MASERAAWLVQLDEMEALKPAMVVLVTWRPAPALDTSTIAYTRSYLLRFNAEAIKAKTGAELIEAMKKAYPQAGEGIALDISAKVARAKCSGDR